MAILGDYASEDCSRAMCMCGGNERQHSTDESLQHRKTT